MVPGGAVTHGSRSAGIVGDHPANGGGCPWIWREEKAFVFEGLIEMAVAHARFHIGLEILFPYFKDLVHLGEIQDDPGPYGDRVSLQTGSCAPSRDRNKVLVRILLLHDL